MSQARQGIQAAIVAGSALVLSRAAWALCPNCLGQNHLLTPALRLVGVFLLVPFAVAATVFLIARRMFYGRAPAPAAPPPTAPASWVASPSASPPASPPAWRGNGGDHAG